DNIIDLEDNCPQTKNNRQRDFNNDGIGDQCSDLDNDNILDNKDNCPEVSNPPLDRCIGTGRVYTNQLLPETTQTIDVRSPQC
ncbi:MAG: thrombospondin type 3 repeat-containing protein, partial [Roseibacillus sp.]|nr:thrombospondin type 3 repeat-containing protein [Roseibacillus sp.]